MRAIAIVSGKGGVGKTTTTINLGMSLNSLGIDTTIVDANIETPDISLSLGAPIIPIALQQVLNGNEEPENATYLYKSGTKIIPSSLNFPEKPSLEKLKKIIKKIKNNTEIILIDSAAGIGENVQHTINAADECLIITNPEMPALTSALKTIKLAEKNKKPILGIVLTRYNKNGISTNDIESFLGYPILGKIPEDKNLRLALHQREPLTLMNENSKASKGYKNLAKLIVDKNDKSSFSQIIKLLSDIFSK